MTENAAESYIRRRAEDQLRRGQSDQQDSALLREHVRALIRVGLLDADVARRILSGYGHARALRGFPDYAIAEGPPTASRAGEDQRVCGCPGEVRAAGATVFPRFVVLGAQRTRLAVILHVSSPIGQTRRRRQPGFNGPPVLKLRDDADRSVTIDFRGGRQDAAVWRGWYQAEGGLSQTTEWIELAGTRLPLHDAGIGAGVRVEDLTEVDASVERRATRYLEHCAEFARSVQHPVVLAAVADVLVACGALTRDAPAVQRALEDAEDRAEDPLVFRARLGHRARLSAARYGGQAREGDVSLLVGATTPAFDGVMIAVTELVVTSYGFTVEIEVFGRVGFGRAPAGLDTARLVFGASDDLGNRYRGRLGESSLGSAGLSGDVDYEPSLDADATALDVVFSTDRARAIVHVPLHRDDWS